MKKTFLLIILSISSFLNAQIQITTGVSADELVENLVGDGVTFSNAVVHGIDMMHGTFSNGSSGLNMDSGVFLTTGNGVDIPGPNSSSSTSTNCNQPGWEGIENTYDASLLEFDFIPESDTLVLKYTFGSEEYSEGVGATFNDIMGVFVSGPKPNGGLYSSLNIAIVPGSSPAIPVGINNVNNGINNAGPCVNCEFYIDNTNGLTLEYDGFTTVLSAWIPVVPCDEYHIVLGVVDVGDGFSDSGIFLQENSLKSPSPKIAMSCSIEGGGECLVEGCIEADLIFSLPDVGYAPLTVDYMLSGSADEGDDYTPIGNTITFEEGEDTVSVHIAAFQDGIIEGEEDIIIITQDELGCQVAYDTLVLTIIDYQTLETETINEISICEGQEVDITVIPIGGLPPYSYEWSNGIPDTTATITVTPDETITYYCTITDACGSSTIDSIFVTVCPQPEVDLGNDTILMQGEELVLDAGEGFASYIWNDFSTNQTLTVTEAGVYWVQVYNEYGCSATDDIEIDFYVGINEKYKENNKFLLFYNPTSTVFALEAVQPGIAKLYSPTGGLLAQKIILKNKKMNWDISSLEKGVYFVHFVSVDNKNRVVKKIIKL